MIALFYGQIHLVNTTNLDNTTDTSHKYDLDAYFLTAGYISLIARTSADMTG